VKISRRTLIGTGAAATGLAAFGGYRVLGPMADREGTIAGFIANHVPQVSTDHPAVTTFASEVMTMVEKRFRWNLDTHMALMGNPFLKRFLSDDQMVIQDDLERTLITTFLRSTDILLANDPDAPVNYLMLADPYAAGCSNPLANLG